MSKSIRLQILIDKDEEKLIKSASKRSGMSLSHWARSILLEKAKSESQGLVDPDKALEIMFNLNLPISDLETMIYESYDSRYK